MGRFDGQVAIVTGAGGGIGREHALLLAREGARVVVNDYGGDKFGGPGTAAPAEVVVEEIEGAGGTAVADAHDVAEAGADVVGTAMDAFGGVHIVVNNAGIVGQGDIDAIEPAVFQRLLDVHLGGTIAVCRAAWPVLRAQRYGRIVNTASGSVYGLPGISHYITAKAGIFGFTRALAKDGAADDIKVNAIMPSAYSRQTATNPALADVMAASFPASLVSPFVGALVSREVPCTGETFMVGGGRAARVVLATVPGFLDATSIEKCLAGFDEALRSDELFVPAGSADQMAFQCRVLGVDAPARTGPWR
jgi:NAD(P)-dependent dehydrogenase (short-subunit alcohol dehydrogenase family)